MPVGAASRPTGRLIKGRQESTQLADPLQPVPAVVRQRVVVDVLVLPGQVIGDVDGSAAHLDDREDVRPQGVTDHHELAGLDPREEPGMASGRACSPGRKPHKPPVRLALGAVTAALDAYAANPALRAAVLIAVPFVGGAFDALAGTAGGNIALDRIGVFVAELGQRIAALEDAKRDPNVTAEELLDATLRALRGAIETGDRVKVRMLASVLVGATSVMRPPGLDAESVLASLVSLTPADLAYARQLAEARAKDPLAVVDFSAAPADPDSKYRLMRLLGAGILEGVTGETLYGGGGDLYYRLTPTFWRILELLRAGGEIIGVEVHSS